MAAASQRRTLVVTVSIAHVLVWIWLSTLGWGGLTALLGHPARAIFVVLILLLTVVGLLSPINLSSGQQEDVGSRRIFVPTVVGVVLLAWLMPYMDRRDLWTINGDVARYSGVAISIVGGILRVWPMFVLGKRFSGLVAIQPGHQLMTEGPYRYVRHPSYLGMMVGLVGWALVFRSSVGLVAAVLGLRLLLERIESEEALLASQFGATYGEYRKRTWRLLPGVY